MDPSAIATVLAALLAAAAAIVAGLYAQRAANAARLQTAVELADRFREPLLEAAFNLQTRLYNIVRQDFLRQYAGPASSANEREYAVENTLYLVGQYFCWVEIVRRESQFLEPRSREGARAVADQMERVL